MSDHDLLRQKDAEKETIRKNVKASLRKLLGSQNLTQQQLGDIMGITTKSTISNYLREDENSVPDIMSLCQIKNYFGIPLDTLISPNFDPKSSFEIDGVNVSEYDKFLGVYILYYIATNCIASNDTNSSSNQNTLSYAVLAIAKDNNGIISLSKDIFKAYACFSIKNIEDALALKREAEAALSTNDLTNLRNIFVSRDIFYTGNFQLILQNGTLYSISLTGYSALLSGNQRTTFLTDKLSILGFNPPNTSTKKAYIGGGIICSSVSRGLTKCPCSQIMIVSRKSLSDYQQEIIYKLQGHHQYFNTTTVANSIMERLEQLESKEYDAEDKKTLLHTFIQTSINEELNNDVSQLFFILDKEDQAIYKFLKDKQTDEI